MTVNIVCKFKFKFISNMSTLFIQYNDNCPEFQNYPLISKVILFYVTAVLIPAVIRLPARLENKDNTVFSISESLRHDASKFSASIGLIYWAITDLIFCSTWKGFYAIEVTGFVLVFSTIYINEEYIDPKTSAPLTPEQKSSNLRAIAHGYYLAPVTFIYLLVMGALIVGFDMLSNQVLATILFVLQCIFFVYIAATKYKYGWVNATDLGEYGYITFSMLIIGLIPLASIV